MKKLFVFVLLLGLLVSSAVSAGTRLKGKMIEKEANRIDFVTGTGEKEQVLENKIKVTALDLIKDQTGQHGIKPSDPAIHVYYYKIQSNGFLTTDHVFGVKGIKLKIENLTDNVLIFRWNESLIQIGETGGMPFIKGMLFSDAGNPDETPNTIIPPKASVRIELYPAVSVKRISGVWENQIVPISDEGTTRVTVTMRVEEEGENNSCSYTTPCINFPAGFVTENKVDMKKK